MALDQAANFVRGTVDSAISAGDTTISVTDASAFPDPSGDNYNLVLWDAGSHNIPDNDPNVEIVRVTGRDTTNDDLTVTRGQESTSDSDHPATSVLQMAWTAKMRDDAESEFTTLQNNIDAAYGVSAIDDTDSPYTTSGEEVITADTSSGAVTVTLATADVSKDAPLTVVNISGSNAVTVNTEGSETIDPGGASSKSWSTEGWAVKFTPDGSNWDSNLDADFESVTTPTANIGDHPQMKQGDATTHHADNTTSIAGDTFHTIFDLGSPVDIVTGSITGPSPSSLRLTYGDGTTETKMAAPGNGEDNAGDRVGVLPVPATPDVEQLEFKNDDSLSRDYGWHVLTK